ncbi:hypothetical protein [Ralstonia pseudosolanacearum]
MKLLAFAIVPIFMLSLVFLGGVWYFYDDVVGYYGFRRYCAREAGARISSRVELNKGWRAESQSSARVLAALYGVGFARYTDERTKESFDVIYLGGGVQRDSSFKIQRADTKMSTAYALKFINQRMDNEYRLSKVGYEIFDINRNAMVARFYNFGYSLFDVDRTFLGSPSGVDCFKDWAGYMPEIQKIIVM